MTQMILPWPAKELSPNARVHWLDEELSALIAAYSNKETPVWLAALAESLGRDKANVCRKARALGLTNQRRPRAEKKATKKRKHATIQGAYAAIGRATSQRIAKQGHPRGALGLRHSTETKKKVSAAAKAMWADQSSKVNQPKHRQMLSDKIHELQATGAMRSGYSRSRGGKRDDLGGVYFRSAWEANYARYLNFLVKNGDIASWAFEPKTFEFTAIKRGTRAYTPDFQVFAHDRSYVWHEVKGWMDAKSTTRLSRFAKYFPNEKLIVIDIKWFKAANKTIGNMIDGWEKGTVRV